MNTQLSLPAGRGLGLALLLHLPLTVHAGQCTVTRLAELPVTMKGMRPTIIAQINGKDALFILDSGAFWSSLTPAAAQQYQLRVDGDRLPLGFQVRGVGGGTDVKITNVATFTLFNIPLHKFDFLAPKEANLRLVLAGLYFEAKKYPESIAQLDDWIPRHSQDVNLPHAYNERCSVRASQGTDLERALSDCNAGLRLNSKSSELLNSRGLVQIRRGAYDKAIADFDAALKLNPRQPWSLYCRGVARVRAGQKQAGEADMSAAMAVNPKIAEQAKRYDIAPAQ